MDEMQMKDVNKYPDAPKACRILAKTILEEDIHRLEHELKGVKALYAIAKVLENDSDAEHALWLLLQQRRYPRV